MSLGGQLGGSLERGAPRGMAAPRTRPRCRGLELRGDGLVDPARRGGKVPCAAVRILLDIQRGRQREMGGPALREGRGAMDRRPHERVAEAQAAGVDRDQRRGLGRRQLAGFQAELTRGGEDGAEIRRVRACGDDEQLLRGVRQARELGEERQLDRP